MINYKYWVANRRHEYQIAVKEHREKELTDFFKNLNDYDAGVRVRKTYNYLKDFVKRKKQKKAMISSRVWEDILKTCEGIEVEFCAEHDYTPLPNPPTNDEIKSILFSACNGKSPGSYRVVAEYIKAADKETLERIIEIIKAVYIRNDMPKEWKKSTQIPILKKSGASEADHFRRISLCNVVYKIYSKSKAKQLRAYAGEPGLHQAAFTANRSTGDHIFVARRMMQEYWNSGQDLFILALDISKAFDNVMLQSIAKLLIDLGVPSRLVDRVLSSVFY